MINCATDGSYWNYVNGNARKPIKGSEGSDFSPVSTENVIPSSCWDPGADDLSQKGHHPQKPETQNCQIFFNAS